MIQKIIYNKVLKALEECVKRGDLGTTPPPDLALRHQVSQPKQEAHGDYASNIALMLSGPLRRKPREIGEVLAEELEKDPLFQKIDVAGPGFLNFFISNAYWQDNLRVILDKAGDYGRLDVGRGQKVLVEYVSANPTGPLHVGHGRGAAIGDSLARILSFAGFSVETEYYINDAGNQMDTLGKSVYLRYQEIFGKEVEFPKECYQGDYIKEIARGISAKYSDRFVDTPLEECLSLFTSIAVEEISSGIKEDLDRFNCHFDHWFSEKTLHESGYVDETIAELKRLGYVYEQDGALWFKATQFGDEKDRVIRRSNGVTTYFAADIAYHRNKLERGFNVLVDVWGADHHGYVPRLKAAIQALGGDKEALKVILVQLVNLLEGGEVKAMSTRAGEFVTLREVLDDVGKDAARFIFLTRRSDSHLDFDLEIARKKSQENPVYYVQYAHARLTSVFEKAKDKGIDVEKALNGGDLSKLDTREDIQLLKTLEAFPKQVESAAINSEPHLIAYYLTELASRLHGYYNKHRFITDDSPLTMARLCLAQGVRQVVKNGLGLLGVSAPERM